MLTIHEEDKLVTVTASGRLTREDYDQFVPAFERIARERGKVAMLIDATQLEGWDIQGLWQDLKFDVTHHDALGPMAVIGDKRWKEWAIKFSRPFFKSAMRFFRPEERDEARRWLSATA